jgi:cytochrome b6-f complex iron-sulfur subunit
MSDSEAKSRSRREFLWVLGNGAILVTAAGASAFSLQFMKPNVLFERSSRVNVGTPEDFSPGTVTADSQNKLYVVRTSEGTFYALSSVCTHLGCITNYRPSMGRIDCPCHGSQFDLEGNVVGGPAPRPLRRVAMNQNDRGDLIVDTATTVDADFILRV